MTGDPPVRIPGWMHHHNWLRTSPAGQPLSASHGSRRVALPWYRRSPAVTAPLGIMRPLWHLCDVFGTDCCADTAAGGEGGFDCHLPRLGYHNQIVENKVGHVFVKGSVIAVLLQI